MICSALKISYIREGVLCHAKIGEQGEQGNMGTWEQGDFGIWRLEVVLRTLANLFVVLCFRSAFAVKKVNEIEEELSVAPHQPMNGQANEINSEFQIPNSSFLIPCSRSVTRYR